MRKPYNLCADPLNPPSAMRYHYRLLNVFAESTFGGNPLCVFEDGTGLDDATMKTIARQFNLSETTFLLPSTEEGVDAHYRIFTVDYEMRFAGHPTLGTAHVLRDMRGGDLQRMRCKAGIVPVTAQGDTWTLTAPSHGAPKVTLEALPAAKIAAMLSLTEDDLAGPATWLDTGTDQLLVPLKTVDAVRRAAPTHLDYWPASSLDRRTAYVFALDGFDKVEARYFFALRGGGFAEDPATGSACANLGGWLLSQQTPLPVSKRVAQGAAIERPSFLHLQVNAQGAIQVGGQVIELGRGYLDLA